MPKQSEKSRLLIRAIVLVFLAEALGTSLLSVLGIRQSIGDALIDAALGLGIMVPVLYLFLFRDSLRAVREREETLERAVDLERSMKKYAQRIVNVVPVGIAGVTPDLGVTFANRVFREMWGIQNAPPSGTPLERFCPIPEISEQAREVVRTGRPVLGKTFEPLWNAATRPVKASFVPLGNVSPELPVVLIVAEDLTDTRRQQERISESESRYRAIVEDQTELICRTAPDGTLTFVNRAFAEFFSFDPSDLVGRKLATPIHPRDSRFVKERRASLTAENPVVRFWHDSVLSTGETRCLQWTERAFFDSRGSVLETQSVALDITGLRRAYEASRENEERFRSLYQSLPLPYQSLDAEGKYLEINEAFTEVFGYTRDELAGRSVTEIMPPDVVPLLQERFPRFKEEGSLKTDLALLHKDGHRIDVQVIGKVRRTADGTFLRTQCVLTDITERKRAEAERQRNEQRVRFALELNVRAPELSEEELFELAIGNAVTLTKSRVGYIHLLDEDQKTVSRVAWNKETVERCSVADDRHASVPEASAWADCARTRQPVVHNDPRHARGPWKSPEGHVSLLRHAAVPAMDGEKVRLVLGVGNKETDYDDADVAVLNQVASDALKVAMRCRAEEALKVSEKRFRVMADAAPVLIWMSGTDKRFSYFNKRWLEFTGQQIETELGDGWAERVHPNDLPGCLATYVESFDARNPFQMEFRLRRHDGAYRWVLDHGIPLTTPQGTFTGYIGSCIDITEIKDSEKILHSSREELRALASRLISVQEAVQTKIARELHDELGQALTGLKIDLKWLSQRFPADSDALRGKVYEMSQLIDETIGQIRTTARSLRPAILDDLGLASAINWQAADLRKRSGLDVGVSIVPEGLVLDPERSTTIFRILQEALTNAVRHAQAEKVEIFVSAADGRVTLQVSDDGVGIPPEAIASRSSLGLVGMRERVIPWGGEVWITGRHGEGTVVAVTLPVGANAEATSEARVEASVASGPSLVRRAT